jgi:nitrogen fixation protein FixH
MRTLIVVLSVVVAAATAVTIIVGTRSFDGVVVEKPYETGLAWDTMREQKVRLGWTVSTNKNLFPLGRNDLFITLYDRNGNLMADAVVSVIVSRPSTNRYDKTYQAVRQPDGRYRASIEFPLSGNWDVIMSVKHGNEQADFTQSVLAKKNRTN